MQSRVGPDMTVSEFWSNVIRFGSKADSLRKFLDASACVGAEKLKHEKVDQTNKTYKPKLKKYIPNLKNRPSVA